MTKSAKAGSGLDPRFHEEASPAIQQAIAAAHSAAMKTPDELKAQAGTLGLEVPIKAKYKIELTFHEGRTSLGPNIVGMQVWESGKRIHGGGDDLAKWCLSTDDDAKNLGCGGIIVSDCIKNGVAMCPHCSKAIRASKLADMKVGNINTRDLSTTLEKVFHALGDSADIYLKFHETDVRYQAMVKEKGLRAAYRLKGAHIYPLRNIIKDTAFGASLQGRFFAFLTS